MKKLLPFYLILYQDFTAAEKYLAGLKAAAFPGGISSFNETVFFGDEITAAQLIELCRTPAFEGRRFILVRRAEKMRKEEKEACFQYLKTNQPAAFLVFLFYAGPKERFPFPENQVRFFLSGLEAEVQDNFGIVRSLDRQDRQRALRILNRQMVNEGEAPKFFGILSWYLRRRVEKKGYFTAEDAELFNYFYFLEKGLRTGYLTNRSLLEMAIIKLTEGTK